MRISDWSSDVCSSDLLFGHEEREARRIVISGGGNIGLFLAREIEETQPSVMLKMIESNKARAEFIAGQLKNAVVLNGDALDMDILNEAKAGSAEAIIADRKSTRLNSSH